MILLVHLSDIHFKTGDNTILARKEKLFDTFKNRIHEVQKVFFVVTGDIAFSGQQDEYLNAVDLFGFLKTETDKISNVFSSVIVVPGNHDCKIDASDEAVRGILIDSVNNDNVNGVEQAIIETCTNCQSNYRDFVEIVCDSDSIVYIDRLLTVYKFTVFDKVVQFNAFNTSWMSRKHEHQGKIGFPVSNYSDEILTNGANLSISLLHHPQVWHNAINARQLEEFLHKHSGIIFTGHEHVKNKSFKGDLCGNFTEYIEGGVMQDSSNSNISDFNLVFVDLDKHNQEIYHFSFDKSMYNLVEQKNVTLVNLNGIIVENLKLNSGLTSYLNDPGILLTNRYSENICLTDIFVYPDCVGLKLDKVKPQYSKPYSSSTILKINDAPYKVLIQGGEKYGKTTFCKIAFSYFLRNKLIPLLINGNTISSPSYDDLVKLLSRQYSYQYVNHSEEDFYQQNFDNFVLIIDDFDKCRLNTKYRAQLLTVLSSKFRNILLAVGDLFKIEEILYDQDKTTVSLDQYKQHRMLIFGNSKRAELISKWNLLGREEEIEEQELVKLNDVAIRLINSVIGKNLVPSYPIFILTLLQSIESGTPHDLKTSSQGHYYNYLITQALGVLRLKADQINFYYTFLGMLSNHLFESGSKLITESELKLFYASVTTKVFVTEQYEQLIDNLEKVKIIENRSGNYRFKYKYVYYFFVAKHFSDHIGDEEVKSHVIKMSERAYNEEFANILMYLTHHSKDPFILNEILSSAKRIFKEYDALELEEDVKVLNQLTAVIPKMVLNADSLVQEARAKKLQHADTIDNVPDLDAKHNEYTNYDLDEDIDNLDLVRQLNLALKTIEILGQLVKNYYGTVPKETTIDLASQTYLISLRALKSFYSFLESNLDTIVNEINSEILAKDIKDKAEKEKFSREMLFFISELVTFGFLKKVSHSIGAENLEEVYSAVYEKYTINSVDMINASISMDFAFTYPVAQIDKIRKKYGHHNIVLQLLRHMAIDYLYMFPVDYAEKQSICKALDIPMKSQRIIDATSTQKLLI